MRIRLVAAAGLALGLVFLTSCRSDPKIAAYVGDASLSEAEVTTLVNDYNTTVEAAAAQTGRPVTKIQNRDAVYVWTGLELCRRLSEQKGFSFQATPLPDEVPAAIKNNPLFGMNQQLEACFAAIPPELGSSTDAETQALYSRVSGPNTPPYEQVLPQLQAGVRVHNALLSADKLTLNPRYSDVNFVGLPLAPSVVTEAQRQATETPSEP